MPSRVRSPTPQKTDLPPWPLATLLISSMITTVLPTPAPPNRPILPPFTNGAIRSMTLMPVSKIWSWARGRRTSASRDGSASARCSPGSAAPPSTGSPSTLRIRPSAASPTGTVIGAAGVDHLHAADHAVGAASWPRRAPGSGRCAAAPRPTSRTGQRTGRVLDARARCRSPAASRARTRRRAPGR